MADQNSKIPNLDEITSMAGKLFTDIKTSVSEIVKDYKQKHDAVATDAPKASATETAAPEAPAQTASNEEAVKPESTEVPLAQDAPAAEDDTKK